MNLTALINSAGQTIIGELEETTETQYKVKNPATLFIQPNQTGQLTVQMFPVFFSELQDSKAKGEGSFWNYPVSSTTIAEKVSLDAKLVNQYNKIFNPSAIVLPEASLPKNVVKLFDE